MENKFETLKVDATEPVENIKVYDLLGRMIIQSAPNKRSFELNTSGVKIGTVLIIEARMEDGSLINTKAIKY